MKKIIVLFFVFLLAIPFNVNAENGGDSGGTEESSEEQSNSELENRTNQYLLEQKREKLNSDLEKAQTSEERSDIQRQIYELSEEYIKVQEAEQSYDNTMSEIASMERTISQLEEKQDEQEKTVTLFEETGNPDLEEAEKELERINDNLKERKDDLGELKEESDNQFSEVLSARESLGNNNQEIIDTNNNAIESNRDSIQPTEGLTGEELKSTLRDNQTALSTIAELQQENLELAREKFNNGQEGRELLNAIHEASTQEERAKAEKAYLDAIDEELSDEIKDLESSKERAMEARNDFCEESKGCIDQPSFEINVGSITPGNLGMEGENIEERTNWVLGTIIQRMMIALGVLSVLMMTIGAGYIILNNGQDELLSKGKSIFMSGIYSILIALASYYLVAIIRYMLFA